MELLELIGSLILAFWVCVTVKSICAGIAGYIARASWNYSNQLTKRPTKTARRFFR